VSRLPLRGEIWVADLDPVRGHEQAGERPVLVISTDTFNQGPAKLLVVAPLTRTDRRIPLHVRLDPPDGGVRDSSWILCDGLRSISRDRVRRGPWGRVGTSAMALVEDRLRILLDL
jgi:mRNA interferase MazF